MLPSKVLRLLSALLALSSSLLYSSVFDGSFTLKTNTGEIYTNCRVLEANWRNVRIECAEGLVFILLKDLPPDFLAQLKSDTEAIREKENILAKAKQLTAEQLRAGGVTSAGVLAMIEYHVKRLTEQNQPAIPIEGPTSFSPKSLPMVPELKPPPSSDLVKANRPPSRESARVDTTAVAAAESDAELIEDGLNGNLLNPRVWKPSRAFKESSISAFLHNGGRLMSVAIMPKSIEIFGNFIIVGDSDNQLEIITRTNGKCTNRFGEFDKGIGFLFQIHDHFGNTANNIKIYKNDYAKGTSVPIATGTCELALNTRYYFRLTDDGMNLGLYINDLCTPLLTAKDSTASGEYIGIANYARPSRGNDKSEDSIQLNDINVFGMKGAK